MVFALRSTENAKAHHTVDYPAELPAVRRGQPFDLATTASTLTVTPVSAGPSTRGRRTGPELHLTVGESVSGWMLARAPGTDDRLRLTPPPDAAIGLYSLNDGSSASTEVAIVCNPFLPADAVHMLDAQQRAEYVLAEPGLIWRGSADSHYAAPWDFAQFDRAVVLSALWLTEVIPFEGRGDVVTLARHLSAAVNSNDDGGVLVGRWSGRYEDGTPPSQWTGSGSILRAFYAAAKPVKYGQCWVFAGVLTSVCRALGIPSRVTTNFSSAHDTTRPYNRAVDMYFDREGDLIENRSRDSIWNFHVWCDVWMKRPDLADAAKRFGLGMDGWQAVDATPQEMSDGIFQMGPSPLAAIKNGLAVDFDTDFVIGEVNADILYYWQKGGDDEFSVQDKRMDKVGRFTSTKAVGMNKRNDVTLEYKHPEGSEEERKAHANRAKPSDKIAPEADQPTELEFSQQFEPRVRFGDDIKVVLKAKNTGSTEVIARFSSLARAVRYTGEPTSRIEKKTDSVAIAPDATAEFVVTLSETEYQPHLVRDVQTVKLNNSAKVGSTGQTWADECVVRVYGDDALAVSAPRTLRIGMPEKAAATVTVSNGFRVPLTNVVITAEGRGLAEPTALKLGTIEPGAKKQKQVPLSASVAGERMLVVTLDTDELQDIIKSISVQVSEQPRMGWLSRLFANMCK